MHDWVKKNIGSILNLATLDMEKLKDSEHIMSISVDIICRDCGNLTRTLISPKDVREALEASDE